MSTRDQEITPGSIDQSNHHTGRLHLPPEVDRDQIPELLLRFSPEIQNGYRKIIFDLSRTVFMDAEGLAFLTRMYDEVKPKQTEESDETEDTEKTKKIVEVTGLNESLTDIFRDSGLLKYFGIDDPRQWSPEPPRQPREYTD